MRLALLSDVHGNFVALDAVLRELAGEPVDRFVFLGDMVALGPQPRQVIGRLRELNCPMILGNTDAWLLGTNEGMASESEAVRTLTTWCAEQLTAQDRAYLQTFAPTLEFSLDEGRKLLCYHGSPRSYDEVISALTPNEVLDELLASSSAAVMAGGHTHIQMIRRYGDVHFVNPGSIGLPGVHASDELPSNRDVHWAEYGLLSVEAGRLSIDLRRTPLDLRAVLDAARASGMPELEWWLSKWRRG